ncbi:MAG TPA: deoxyribonuclease IV, partial [Bacillota bacterium]
DLGPLVMHIPYTVNLAAPAEATWQFAVRVLREDTERAGRVRAAYVVTHPGSHTRQSDAEQGLRRIIAALEEVRPVIEALHAQAAASGAEGGRSAAEGGATAGADGAPMLLLETMAGQGTEIGHRPEQLERILDGLGRPPWLGVCVDTCHVFAAGYDLRQPSEVDRLAEDLDVSVGLERVRVVHVNDSKAPVGSRVDRHECVGRGHIGLEGLLNVIDHKAFRGRPLILETPVDVMPDGWGEEIRLLRQASRSGRPA